MILCLDVGNTDITAGLFNGETLILNFRHSSDTTCTADDLGLFFIDTLAKHNCRIDDITAISLSSVVPAVTQTLMDACNKYFKIVPRVLTPDSDHPIQLDVDYPNEVGADRIANVIAATHFFPNKNLIILDFGTATTACAVTKNKAFIGGAILPGLKLSIEALANKASQLSSVEIIKPTTVIGRNTTTNIQSGVYYSQLGAMKEVITGMNREVFNDDPAVVMATGGFADLFVDEGIYEKSFPDLTLHGLRLLLDIKGKSNVG